MGNTQIIDLAEALKRAMGDANFLKMMLHEFQSTIPDVITRLINACQKGDLEGIGKHAHQFKGAAANLGAKALAEAALKLEQIGKSADPDGCDRALEEFKAAAENFSRHVAGIDWAGVNACQGTKTDDDVSYPRRPRANQCEDII